LKMLKNILFSVNAVIVHIATVSGLEKKSQFKKMI